MRSATLPIDINFSFGESERAELLCPECGASFSTQSMPSHQQGWGPEDQVVECNQCGTIYGHAVTVGHFDTKWMG